VGGQQNQWVARAEESDDYLFTAAVSFFIEDDGPVFNEPSASDYLFALSAFNVARRIPKAVNLIFENWSALRFSDFSTDTQSL
jgi:hypothetical protein